MTKGYIREAVWGDVSPIAAHMRPADVAEVFASTGAKPEGALYSGLLTSAFGGKVRTICLSDSTPVSMLGVLPTGEPGVGAVWLLATDRLLEIQTLFLRRSRETLAELTQGYRVVYNYTDARNTVHHRWLQWMGFTIIQRHEEWGHARLPFLEFCKITEEHHV